MNKSIVRKILKIHELSQEILVEAAEDPSIDKSLLRKMYEFDHDYLKTTAILNPNIPSAILEEHFSLNNGEKNRNLIEERIHVVFNPALDFQRLKNIARKDPSKEVREAALTSLAIRLGENPKSKRKDIIEIYQRIKKQRFSSIERKELAINTLQKNLSFPKDFIKKKKKSKTPQE